MTHPGWSVGVGKQTRPRKVSGELQEKGAEAGKPQGQPGNRPVGAIRVGVQGSRPGQSVEGLPQGRRRVSTSCPPRTECVRGPRKGFLGIHTSQSPSVLWAGWLCAARCSVFLRLPPLGAAEPAVASSEAKAPRPQGPRQRRERWVSRMPSAQTGDRTRGPFTIAPEAGRQGFVFVFAPVFGISTRFVPLSSPPESWTELRLCSAFWITRSQCAL